MYPSSSSSSSHKSMASASSASGLTRYGSAPGSFLTTAVDSVITNPNNAAAGATGSSTTITREFSVGLGSSPTHHHHPPRAPHAHHHHHHPPPFMHYFSGDSSSVSSESTCKGNSSNNTNNGNSNSTSEQHHHHPHLHLSKETGNKVFDVGDGSGSGLHRCFGLSEMGGVGVGVGGSSSSSCSSSSNLVRQRSSPAGFLGHLSGENAFSLGRGIGSSNGGHGVARLKSQLSFTRQDSPSRISEVNEAVIDGVSTDDGHHDSTHSYAATSFGIEPWENTASIIFSAPPGKRARNIEGDIYFGPSDSQFGFPHEMPSVEKLPYIPEDSVPCKIRAKRGCATHPRSIAERERRTRISGRLKKLQELVPNMDKQTSYADMLDLAVQHIKTLQNQVQKLRHDLDNCTCGCKPST